MRPRSHKVQELTEKQVHITEEIEAVIELIRNALPLPALEKLGVPFNPVLVRCQAPSAKHLQCKRPAGHISRIVYSTGGRPGAHYHDTCWQHTQGEVRARPGKLRVIRGGKR